MQLIKDDRVSKRLMREVLKILECYPVEEVQSAINLLVNDSNWLKQHKNDSVFLDRNFDVV